ncbi:MAG: YdcH family protein [Terricaulis sp.]
MGRCKAAFTGEIFGQNQAAARKFIFVDDVRRQHRKRGASSDSPKLKEAPSMAIEQRLRELDARHRDLDIIIKSEAQHPSVDATRLSAMKRQKLKLKEEIEQLRQSSEHH